MADQSVTFQDILAARERIAPHAHRTPVMTCAAIDDMAGRELFFKCENFQKVGAFKFRGACNAVMKLPPEVAERGVVTHSSGNHAQALALAAKIRGVRAHIVMPTNAPTIKRRAVEGYGAKVYSCEPTLEAREKGAAEVIAATGATLIHPYDNADIIAGQGTCALELLEQMDATSRDREGAIALDAIIAPVGGGGLMSGTSIAARAPGQTAPRLFGAEPTGADDAARSLAAGRIIPQTNPDTIADGLRTSLGELTFAILSAHLETIITVTDEEIIRAMRLIWERMKIIIEPSSATVLAAVLSDQFKSLPRAENLRRIGLILSGGNVDLDHLPWMQ